MSTTPKFVASAPKTLRGKYNGKQLRVMSVRVENATYEQTLREVQDVIGQIAERHPGVDVSVSTRFEHSGSYASSKFHKGEILAKRMGMACPYQFAQSGDSVQEVAIFYA